MSYKSNQSNTTYKSHKTYMTYIVLFVLLCSFFVTPQKTVHAGVLSRPPVSLGLIDYWSLDEGTGTTARDTASGNKDLTLGAGITWTQGKISKGLSSLTNTAAGSGTSQITNFPFTLSVWSRSTGNNGSGRAALGLVKSGTEYFVVGFSSTNGTPFMAGRNTSFTDAASTAKGLNAWVYLTAVFTSATQRDLYVNGQLANSDTRSVPFVSGSVVNYLMYPMGGNALLDVDEARVYNRALTASEVDRLYKTSGQSVRKGVSNSGLMGYWPMNEGRGLTVGDSSGQGNTGTITGATWTNGKKGGALSFNGSSYTSITGTNANDFNFSSTVTIGFWMKGSTNLNTVILEKSNNNNHYHFQTTNEAMNNDGNHVLFGVTGMPSTGRVSSAKIVSDGSWHYVVGTFDSSVNTLKIYVDGVLDKSNTGATDEITTNSQPLLIGSRSGSVGFPGVIDDVRIFYRVLSATEVQNLYTQSSAVIGTSYENRLTNGLVGFWTMDGKDISGATVADKSGQGNNGTISGATPTIGKVGQGLKFDGVDDVVSATLPNLPTMSVSMWIKIPQIQPTERIFDREAYPPIFRVFDNGTFQFIGSVFLGSTGTLNANQWYHIVATGDSSGHKIYVNGVLDNSDPTAYTVTETKDLWIGGTVDKYYGLLDEFRIYNRALSADEVKQLYRMGQ